MFCFRTVAIEMVYMELFKAIKVSVLFHLSSLTFPPFIGVAILKILLESQKVMNKSMTHSLEMNAVMTSEKSVSKVAFRRSISLGRLNDIS